MPSDTCHLDPTSNFSRNLLCLPPSNHQSPRGLTLCPEGRLHPWELGPDPPSESRFCADKNWEIKWRKGDPRSSPREQGLWGTMLYRSRRCSGMSTTQLACFSRKPVEEVVVLQRSLELSLQCNASWRQGWIPHATPPRKYGLPRKQRAGSSKAMDTALEGCTDAPYALFISNKDPWHVISRRPRVPGGPTMAHRAWLDPATAKGIYKALGHSNR